MVKITNPEQMKRLVEIMEKNISLATNFKRGVPQSEDVKNGWESVAATLNFLGPPVRTEKEWQKVWCDAKFKVKQKLVYNKKQLEATGGGPFKQKYLNEVDAVIAQILDLSSLVNPNGKVFGNTNPPKSAATSVCPTVPSSSSALSRPSTSSYKPKTSYTSSFLAATPFTPTYSPTTPSTSRLLGATPSTSTYPQTTPSTPSFLAATPFTPTYSPTTPSTSRFLAATPSTSTYPPTTPSTSRLLAATPSTSSDLPTFSSANLDPPTIPITSTTLSPATPPMVNPVSVETNTDAEVSFAEPNELRSSSKKFSKPSFNKMLERQTQVQEALYNEVKESLKRIEGHQKECSRYQRKLFYLEEERLKLYKVQLEREENQRIKDNKFKIMDLEIRKKQLEIEERKLNPID